jgi:hypothetical protein
LKRSSPPANPVEQVGKKRPRAIAGSPEKRGRRSFLWRRRRSPDIAKTHVAEGFHACLPRREPPALVAFLARVANGHKPLGVNVNRQFLPETGWKPLNAKSAIVEVG